MKTKASPLFASACITAFAGSLAATLFAVSGLASPAPPATAAVSPVSPAPASQPATQTAAAKRVFYWSMETEKPEVFPEGSSDKRLLYPPNTTFRTDKVAHSGKFSLDLSGQAWRQATFDNPTNNHVWATPQQGAIVMYFRYSGTLNGPMLMQLTGKTKDKKLDTNDGLSIRILGNNRVSFGYGWDGSTRTTSVKYEHGKAFEADRWYKVTAKWNTAAAPHLSLQIDDNKAVTGGQKPGATQCVAWHHLLWGNDTRSVPEAFYIDDVQVFDGPDIPAEK